MRTIGPRRLALALALSCLGAAAIASADPPVRDDLLALDLHLRDHPEDIGALIARSDLRRRSGEPDEALLDLRVAEALAPGDARIGAQRALVLHAIGRDDEALSELDGVAARSPAPSFAALALRARVLTSLGRLAEAADDFDAALALSDDVDLYLERGRLLERLGRLEDAARGYHEGLGALGAVSLRVAAVDLDLRMGRPERALPPIDEILRSVSARARWLLLRGRALDALGRHDEARAARESALAELDRRLARRTSPALRVERGEALLAMGRPIDALAEAARARAIAPSLEPAIDLELRARRLIGGAR